MLRRVSDPRKKGVKLMEADSDEFTTKSGWYVKGFTDDRGNVYEHATRGDESRWYLLEM